jgi:hypothetical protein
MVHSREIAFKKGGTSGAKKWAIFIYKQEAPTELEVVDCQTPSESPVYSPNKSKIWAPEEPPFRLKVLKAISLWS